MERPSKKQIKSAVERLKNPPTQDGELIQPATPALSPKKTNKNGIRKKGAS